MKLGIWAVIITQMLKVMGVILSMRRNHRNFSRFSRPLLTPVFAAMLLQSGVAAASDEVQGDTASDNGYVAGEIIVTAQRRSESLQKVPVAMTALNAEALANQGVTNLSSLSTAAPSLKVVAYPNSSDTLTLTMRGQGAGDVGQLTRDGGVAIYIDGFYMARPQGALLDLGDPERIEILRGPQGTLYGRNTTGGAVNVVTSKPTGEWGGYGTLSFGSRNLVRSTASVDLPAVGNLAVKGTIVYVNQDGFAKNDGAVHDFGEFGQIAGRVAAQWTPSDDFTARYAFNRGRVSTTPLYYITPALDGITTGPLAAYDTDPYKTYKPLDLVSSVSNFVDHQFTMEYDLSDSFSVRSLTAYRGFTGSQNMNYGYAFSSALMPMTVEQFHNYRTRQYSQELQIVGDISDRLTFTGGLYWYKEKGSHNVRTLTDMYNPAADLEIAESYDAGYLINTTSESYAAYAQSTLTPGLLDDRLKLTVGGRYTKDKRRASRDRLFMQTIYQPQEVNDQKFDNFSPMANLAVEWSNDLMTYVKYSQAYKAGGSGEASPDFAQTFGPEKVTAWEAGFKAQALDRKLTLNAAAFLNKFDDMQIDFIASPWDTSVISTSNAGKASIKGVEVDLTFRPTADFSINASFSHLDQEIKRVSVTPGSIFDGGLIAGRDDGATYAVGDNIANLFVLPFVPKYSYSVGADWTFLRQGRDSFSAHANYAYQSAVQATSGSGPAVAGREFARSDRSKNLNARINWKHETVSGPEVQFSIFADNLLNDRRSDFAIGLGGTALTGFQLGAFNYNEPRTIGGELKLSF
jgi:iron complex outermembrane receptor protein